MSAEKGGALVRSPPSIYSHQSVGWGGPSSALQNSQPHRQSIRATVTKLSSGDSNKTNKYEFASVERKIQAQELEQPCNCGGWSKAKQLAHDLVQLRGHHEAILNGLFQEVEELKRRNRDLTFAFLLGPNPTLQNSDIPTDAHAQAIVNIEREDRSTSISEADLDAFKDLSITGKPILSNAPLIKNSTDIMSTLPDQSWIAPLRTSSSVIELLEEEKKEANKQIQEEKRKNDYLWRVVEELKRQVLQAKNGKKEDINKNYRNSSINQLGMGHVTRGRYSVPSNQSVRPLYLPAIDSKNGSKKSIEKQMSTSFSFGKSSDGSPNALKNSMLRNSCPALPSISTNDGFARFQGKESCMENQNETDYQSPNCQSDFQEKQEIHNNQTSIPGKVKKLTKKEKVVLGSTRPSAETLISRKLEQPSQEAIMVQYEYQSGGSPLEVSNAMNSTWGDTPGKQVANMCIQDDRAVDVDCVTLGNTVSIIDMPNTSSSSSDVSSARSKTKSKGRRSGRNKKRKTGLQRYDTDT